MQVRACLGTDRYRLQFSLRHVIFWWDQLGGNGIITFSFRTSLPRFPAAPDTVPPSVSVQILEFTRHISELNLHNLHWILYLSWSIVHKSRHTGDLILPGSTSEIDFVCTTLNCANFFAGHIYVHLLFCCNYVVANVTRNGPEKVSFWSEISKKAPDTRNRPLISYLGCREQLVKWTILEYM